ncbi:DUF4023 domain-containing protein [Bacillus fonticola]|nr:DUF4023 domain-containing protein [Bacillus fonticola]
MESTNEFVKKVQDNQKKAEQNKKRQGSQDPSNKLPNKQH